MYLMYVWEMTDDLEFMSKGTQGFDERYQLAVNLQAALIQIISTFTTSSPECRKTVIKLFSNLKDDHEVSNVLLGVFIKHYKSKNITAFPTVNAETSDGEKQGGSMPSTNHQQDHLSLQTFNSSLSLTDEDATGNTQTTSNIRNSVGDSGNTITDSEKNIKHGSWWGGWSTTAPKRPSAVAVLLQ